MSPLACPDTPDLRAILEGDDASDQPVDLIHHLDSCVECQRALETLAGDPTAWEEVAIGLGEVVWNEPALQHVVAQLKTEELVAPEDKDLSFLRPADKPGLIGLFGSYAVLGEIGRGGMGIVLKAFDPVLNRVVALKVLSPRLATSATARQRFLREGRAVAAVCHDHIVSVHGVSEADGLPYLVMQHIAGESLQDRLDRIGPLELEEIVQIGLQTAAGLAAAHARGLIHRDIKPANLLLESLSPSTSLPHGENAPITRVKITDFGLARLADDVQVTRNGVLTGTPQYMAPEQARGEPVDHRADLFSLGSVLYALCTGVSPFRGSTVVAVLRQVSDETPAPIHSLNSNIPAWLETLVAKLMAKDPVDRVQSAEEVAILLQGYLAHLHAPATIPAPELPPQIDDGCLEVPSSDLRTGYTPRCQKSLWVAAFLLFAAVGLGAWFTGAAGQLVPETAKAQDYHQSFKSDVMSPDFEFCGPNAIPCVEFTPDGLRITLPAGWPGERLGTGVTTRKPITGDFEITVTFEFLQEPQPGESQTLFSVDVVLDKPGNNYASICRSVGPDGKTNFLTWISLEDEQTGKPLTRGQGFPTKTKVGRLRVVRWGSVLSYYVAEGSSTEFNLIQQYPFGKEDLKEVRILGSTGGSKASLDVRVTDLRIRLQGFAKPAPIMKAIKSPAAKQEHAPTRDYPQEYIQSFKGTAVQPSGWDLEGPAPERCVKFEPAGLRIAVPTGRVDEGPSIGVTAGFSVKGDFEITMGFEILNAGGSANVGDVSTRLSLVIFKDTPNGNVATLSRSITPKDGVAFVAWQSLWNEAAGKGDTRAAFLPSKATTGRLRLVRSGADLFFCVAEGTDADFKVVKKFPFGAEDLKSVRIIGSTGGEKAFLDARVTDLRIRAMALPNVPASSRPNAPQAESPSPNSSRSRGWLATALLSGLGLILALATLASITFVLRKRFPAHTASAGSADQPAKQGSVFVSCPECERKLKIKTDLAGKRVKCPGCGTFVLVPAAVPAAPKNAWSSARKMWLFASLGLGCASLALLLLGVLFFWPATSPTTSFMDIPLGNQLLPGVADSGFYHDENDGEGPFRWTNGKGRLVIPLAKNERPQALLMQLDRLENCSLRILVNHREVLKEEPSPNRLMWWEKTIDLNGVQLETEVIVEIISNTRPDQVNSARREIGVLVRGIKLLSRRGEEKLEEKKRPSSFLNVALGGYVVPRIEESGFHPTERGMDGRFRWTKGKAKLVIPLHKNERPQAILVQLGLPRTRSVRITVNDHELLDEKASEQGPVVSWLWEKTLDVSGIDLGDKVTVEISSNIQPLLIDPRGEKTDARELGVAVRGIKLLGANK